MILDLKPFSKLYFSRVASFEKGFFAASGWKKGRIWQVLMRYDTMKDMKPILERELSPMSQSQSKPSLKTRIALIDEIRGFCILAMILHHALFDIVYLFNDSWFMPLLQFAESIRMPFVFAFVGISGLSSRLSHSNALRGVKLLGIALGLTLVTWLVMPEELIVFGILHMLAFCMLIFALLRPLLDKAPTWLGIVICLLLFVLTSNVGNGQLGVPNLLYWQIPEPVMQCEWLFPFGITTSGFYSADYFPLFPWLFLFLAGSYVGVWFKEGRYPKWMAPKRIPFLDFVGRHTLWVYVIHQPIVYGILYVIYNWILA